MYKTKRSSAASQLARKGVVKRQKDHLLEDGEGWEKQDTGEKLGGKETAEMTLVALYHRVVSRKRANP